MNLLKDKKFQDFLKKTELNPNVLACILFGSQTKNPKPNSDIDICIIKKDITQIEGFEELYNYKNMDLVFLNNLPQVMKFKILTQGKILHVKNKQEFNKIRRKIVFSYLDFEPYLNKQYKRMMANV